MGSLDAAITSLEAAVKELDTVGKTAKEVKRLGDEAADVLTRVKASRESLALSSGG